MREKSIKVFNHDVQKNAGYLYTGKERLSARLANNRISKAIFSITELKGKNIIDIGCGDGTYSIELLEQGPRKILGVDAAQDAIDLANQKTKSLPNLSFEQVDIYNLKTPAIRYDIAIVRCILHHLYDLEQAIARICGLANEVIVVEPNGYNPVLKIIEKTSRYHIEHEEKSYFPHKLDKLFKKNGGKIVKSKYIGLVPMFCPDKLAKFFKLLEPIIENTFLFRELGCAQYVQKIHLDHSPMPLNS